MANIGQRELRNLTEELAIVEEEKQRWLRERSRLVGNESAWTGELDEIDTRLERIRLSSLDDRETRRMKRELVRTQTSQQSDAKSKTGDGVSDTELHKESPSAVDKKGHTNSSKEEHQRESQSMHRDMAKRLATPSPYPDFGNVRKAISFAEELNYEDELLLHDSKTPLNKHPEVLPPSFLKDDDGHMPLEERLMATEADMEKQVRNNILVLREKERKMERERQKLKEEDMSRVNRLQDMELKIKELDEKRMKEQKIMRHREMELEIVRQRQLKEDQDRIDYLHAYELQQRQIAEAKQREQRIHELKEEERRIEDNLQSRLLEEQKQRDRLHTLTLEEERMKQQLRHDTESAHTYRLIARSEEQDRLMDRELNVKREQEKVSDLDKLNKLTAEGMKMKPQIIRDTNDTRYSQTASPYVNDSLVDWELAVQREQEKHPERDRLQVLFEAEQRLAQAIAEEMRKKEDRQRKEETEEYEHVRNIHECTHDTKQRNRDGHQGTVYIKPTITAFSGTEPVPKNECSFEIWTLEVESLMATYPDYLVSQAIRHSLRGEARRVLLPLGPLATSHDIVEKMDGVYGSVVSGESVLQQLYSTRQTAGETVTSWGLRLKEILQKAIRKGQIKPEQRNEMIRIKFWRGLMSTDLKNATRMYFETESNFEDLRKKVRSEECEIESNQRDTKPPASEKKHSTEGVQQQQIQLNQEKTMFADLVSRMERMEKKMDDLSKSRKGGWYSRNRNYQNSDAEAQKNGSKVGAQKQNQPQLFGFTL